MWAVFTDPPAHTRLRGLMNKAFTPRAVERVRPRIQEIVDELIDRVCHLGRMDVIRDVASPLPVTVIAEMLGVPKEDRERLKTWSDELALFIGSALATPDKYERAGHSIMELSEYFRSLIAARRAHAHDDMLSALIAAEERDAVLSEDELVATCVLLLFAGHETTTNLIGNGLLGLLRDPDQLEVLRAEPSLAPLAVEELLRYDGPTPAMVRVAAEDMKIGDKRIKRGDRIFAIINAANRDPAQFADPDRLDLRREPNRHIAFGFGIHFCIGAPLARLEGQIAFATLLRRLSDLELLTTAPEWLDSVVFRGVKSLPVSFRLVSPHPPSAPRPSRVRPGAVVAASPPHPPARVAAQRPAPAQSPQSARPLSPRASPRPVSFRLASSPRASPHRPSSRAPLPPRFLFPRPAPHPHPPRRPAPALCRHRQRAPDRDDRGGRRRLAGGDHLAL
jgi:hypothetical protein